MDITKTPLGTHIVVYTMRPGLVIGRGGETIKALARTLEERFGMPNPQISVAEVEIPELNANIVASRITSALKRGVHYRRAGFWALNQVMEAGALGAEIIISGKLRTDRSRYEKFRTDYLPKSGDAAARFARKASLHVQLKPGILGIKVYIMPPDAEFPDQVRVIERPIDDTPEETEPVTEETKAELASTEESKKPPEPDLTGEGAQKQKEKLPSEEAEEKKPEEEKQAKPEETEPVTEEAKE